MFVSSVSKKNEEKPTESALQAFPLPLVHCTLRPTFTTHLLASDAGTTSDVTSSRLALGGNNPDRDDQDYDEATPTTAARQRRPRPRPQQLEWWRRLCGYDTHDHHGHDGYSGGQSSATTTAATTMVAVEAATAPMMRPQQRDLQQQQQQQPGNPDLNPDHDDSSSGRRWRDGSGQRGRYSNVQASPVPLKPGSKSLGPVADYAIRIIQIINNLRGRFFLMHNDSPKLSPISTRGNLSFRVSVGITGIPVACLGRTFLTNDHTPYSREILPQSIAIMRSISFLAILLTLVFSAAASPTINQDKREPGGGASDPGGNADWK
ncbi:hypothetical protein EDB84DRAFT_1442229 [Lactarius hengduanensis]|nr:hypothetical protein EDB84DRAFT_1442229 [Lactarius hengduanensis]